MKEGYSQRGTTSSKRLIVVLARWVIPVGILGAFLVTGHLQEALSTLAGVHPGWAVLLTCIGVGLPMSHAWRWSLLLERTGERLAVARSASITALASLLNYAAPGFLGAPAKALFARNSDRISISRSLPTLAAEQLLDAVALAIAGLISVLIIGPAAFDFGLRAQIAQERWAIVGAGVLILVAGVAIWLIGRRLLPAFTAGLKQATATLLRGTERRGSILALTGVRWLLDMAAVGVASIAIGLRLSVVEVLLIANLALLAGMVAPVPGGLGVREAVMASLGAAIGVSLPAILALSVLHRASLALGLPIVLAGARIWERGRQ